MSFEVKSDVNRISILNFKCQFLNFLEYLQRSLLSRPLPEPHNKHSQLTSLLHLHTPIVLYLISIFQMQSIPVNYQVGLETYYNIGPMRKYIPNSKWLYPLINLELNVRNKSGLQESLSLSTITDLLLCIKVFTVGDTEGYVITFTISVHECRGQSSNECQAGRKHSKCKEKVQFGRVGRVS